ncbi:MAG: hypothetical protein WA906_00615 [Pacificimonas sp.]
MDGWFILGFFMIVVGIPVLAGVFGKLGKRWLDIQEKQLELTAKNTTSTVAAQAVHIEKLEQRMRVLERIATDKGTSLAARIEDLRDEDQTKELN